MKVQEGKASAFMEWAVQVDKDVEAAETGMISHTLNQEEGGDPHTYSWMEIYQDDAALFAHM